MKKFIGHNNNKYATGKQCHDLYSKSTAKRLWITEVVYWKVLVSVKFKVLMI